MRVSLPITASLGRTALLALLAIGTAQGQQPPGATPDGTLTLAPRPLVRLDKLTWSDGREVTRLRFHATRALEAVMTRPVPTMVRVDLPGVDASAVPESIRVSSREVVLVRRVPVPEPNPTRAARFIVQLASGDLALTTERDEGGVTILIGMPERVGTATIWADGGSWTAEAVGQVPAPDEPPEPEERLVPAVPFVVSADQPVRTGPSPLHTETSRATAGQTKIADAQRGPWVHLTSGGWLLHALPVSAASPAGLTQGIARRPVAWSVITIGTGLALEVTEVLRGTDPKGEELGSRFASHLQIARLDVRLAGPAAVGIRLPAKEGRLVLTLRGGVKVRSLDPRALPLRDEAERAEIDAAFPAPLLYPGESWTTWLFLPGDMDFLDVVEAQIDVDGKPQRLFRLPGSGEPVE